MPQITAEMVTEIATMVANLWRNKGIRSYSYEDMYQDAAMAAVHAAKSPNYIDDPSADPVTQRSRLRGYCYTAAKNHVYQTCTRGLTPVSAKGHDQTFMLGQTKGVAISERHVNEHGRMYGTFGTSTDDLIESTAKKAWRTRVQNRVRKLSLGIQPEDLDVGLHVIMKAVDKKTLAKRGYDPDRLRAVTVRLRRRLANDRNLYNLAKEAP